jgi:hypothetical protein
MVIVHLGETCTMMYWETDGVVFTLANSNDPPGQIRYSCDDLRKVVESLR